MKTPTNTRQFCEERISEKINKILQFVGFAHDKDSEYSEVAQEYNWQRYELEKLFRQAQQEAVDGVVEKVLEFINQEQEVLINRGSDGKDKWIPEKIKLSTVSVDELAEFLKALQQEQE